MMVCEAKRQRRRHPTPLQVAVPPHLQSVLQCPQLLPPGAELGHVPNLVMGGRATM